MKALRDANERLQAGGRDGPGATLFLGNTPRGHRRARVKLQQVDAETHAQRETLVAQYVVGVGRREVAHVQAGIDLVVHDIHVVAELDGLVENHRRPAIEAPVVEAHVVPPAHAQLDLDVAELAAIAIPEIVFGAERGPRRAVVRIESHGRIGGGRKDTRAQSEAVELRIREGFLRGRLRRDQKQGTCRHNPAGSPRRTGLHSAHWLAPSAPHSPVAPRI